MADKRKRRLIDDGTGDWPVCIYPRCTNKVDPRRVAMGHRGCIEEHPTAAPERILIPVPKSGSVVGNKKDLAGVVNSHKTGIVQLTPEDFTHYATVKPRVKGPRKVIDPLFVLYERIKEAPVVAGGIYIKGELVLGTGYKLGLVTSPNEPARLTNRGELVRNILLQGRVPNLEQLK